MNLKKKTKRFLLAIACLLAICGAGFARYAVVPAPEPADNRKVWYNVWDEAKATNRTHRTKPGQTVEGRSGRFYAAKAS